MAKQTKIHSVLKQYYGYDSFRNGQEEIINKVIEGNDVLGIMPTGGGKSICYQIPAILLEGVTIVISPLISLMKDQVDTLNEIGISAAYINSSLSNSDFNNVLTNAKKGDYKLIYVAPERLETHSFIDFLNQVTVSMIAIDEAHCVSQWGHDFRPSYTRISKLIKRLTKRPIIAAFTATATLEVKEDIIRLLDLLQPFVLTTGFNRENLYFEVLKPQDKFRTIRKYLNQHKKESGIIYCATRKTVESVTEKLNLLGFSATKYHAGVSENERTSNQEDFIYDRKKIMVATNAFGMGIDKSNIRYVIHYNMPKNMEAYYQEAGRAGRDGLESECVLLYSASDIVTNKFFIGNMNEENQSHAFKKLNEMVDYCNTDKCLRSYILTYFGEKEIDDECDHCANCNNDVELTDITVESQKIMSCVKRMEERFGSGIVASVLKGSKAKKIKEQRLDQLSTHGIMKDYHLDSIKEIISFLVSENYLTTKGNKYPTIALTSRSKDVLFSKKTVMIKRIINKDKSGHEVNHVDSYDERLFEQLRSLRSQLSKEAGLPPFVIFSDATLQDMSRKFPQTNDTFLTVSGVGERKLTKYGTLFIDVINDYLTKHQINTDQYKTNLPLDDYKKPVKTTNKQSNIESYELFIKGLTLEEIAKQRGLALSTIEGHLLKCLENGHTLEFDRLINQQYEMNIIEAIDQVSSNKLREIKDSLPEEVSYTDIKFTIAKHNL